MDSDASVLYERDGEIVVLTLDRSHRLNAFTDDQVRALDAVLQRFDHDEAANIAIICGAGRGFLHWRGCQVLTFETRHTRHEAAPMPYTIKPLSPVLGAEVLGLDLCAPLTDATFDELRAAWVDANGVLVFRDQQLAPEAQIEFSQRFGELEEHVAARFLLPGYPEIYRVSTKRDADGKAMGNPESGRYWHSDLSYLDPPAMASLLYALEIPPMGGDTMFTNMAAAFAGLSEPVKTMLDGLYAVHDYVHVLRLFSRPIQVDTTLVPPVRHPVVRPHADSGRKTLYVNSGFTTHIEGMARHESDAILAMLYSHATRPEFVYRHKWSVGDAVLWDNRSTMHHAVHDFYDTGGVRHMHRTTVMGAKES